MSKGRFARGARHVIEASGVLMFGAMFVGFAIQVVSRYVFNRPVIWSNDLILWAFLWWFCWGVAFSVSQRQHIAVEFALPVRNVSVRNALARLGLLICASAFIVVLPGSADYILFSFRQVTGALEIPLGVVFGLFLLLNVAVPVRMLLALREPLPAAPLAQVREFVE